MDHTSMAYPQPSQDDICSTRGSIRGGPGNGEMFDLDEAVVGEEVMPFCCPLVGNELANITNKVCGSGEKTGVNTRLPGSLFGGFVDNSITC